MAKPDLSIIIVSYNTKDLTVATVKSLINHTPRLQLEIIVVDNNSTDGTVDALHELKKSHPQLRVLAESTNHGFGGGNNLGATHATSDYLAFINSDTIANQSTCAPLLTYLQTHPECGLVAPKIVLEDGHTPQAAAFGPEPTLWSLLFRQQQQHDRTEAHKTQTVDWVTGAAFIIRRKLYEQIKGFDEAMFMYYEDVDLCRRVRDAGFTVVWLPEATIIHLGGRSIASTWRRKKWYYTSQQYYMRKHAGLLMSWLVWLLRLPFVLYYRLRG